MEEYRGRDRLMCASGEIDRDGSENRLKRIFERVTNILLI